MNYYYEIDERYNGHVFGETWRYWCMYNCSPADGGKMCFKTHDDFVAHSSRVWLENANGVYQIKPDWYGHRNRIDSHEFMIIKIKSKTIKWWQDES